MKDQNSPPPMNNFLGGVITSTLSSWGIQKNATPYAQYVDWGNNTNYISMKDQNSPPPMNNMLFGVKNITFIFIRDQNSPPPMKDMLIRVITSTLSS